jgi:Ca2+-transporting ATPase
LFAHGHSIQLQPALGSLPEDYHTLLEFALLASHRNPFDPMETAIHAAVAATLADTEHVHADWRLVDEYPLSKELLAMSRVWHAAEREEYAVAAKGAPEAIIDLCHLDATTSAAILQQVAHMATLGLRVLGVAKASFEKISLPPIQHDFVFEFIGLIALADPIRADVPAAVAECLGAGIRVVMITGDHPTTAISIARQIGLDTGAGFINGSELHALDDEQLALRIRSVNVFCRVSPEQKLRLVTALKKNGEIVAMTGDGVNDAPAIRAAHIGIAMGARGTDVAREAADLVLMDDAFAAIVAAVRMGRRTYDNLSKAITFVIAVHVPIIGLTLLPLLFDLPLLLMPVHILFLQLLIDPACSLVFESAPEEMHLMQRPPRPRLIPLFHGRTLARGLLQGALLSGVLATMYYVMLHQYDNVAVARTATYATMILANLGLILSNLSVKRQTWRERVPVFKWISLATLAALALILLVPSLRELFFFAKLDAPAVAAIIVGASLGTLGFEAVKELLLLLPCQKTSEPPRADPEEHGSHRGH